MKDTEPHFIASIMLYPTNQGGRKSPIVGAWFGCPCKFHEADQSAWDCRILTNGNTLAPGETKDFGIVFQTSEIAPVFAKMQRFFLWEGRIIGEARRVR
jgi:hypothetical protein